MNDHSEKAAYERPVLMRYAIPAESIKEYQGSTGSINSIKCTNPENCLGGAGTTVPAWLEPA